MKFPQEFVPIHQDHDQQQEQQEIKVSILNECQHNHYTGNKLISFNPSPSALRWYLSEQRQVDFVGIITSLSFDNTFIFLFSFIGDL